MFYENLLGPRDTSWKLLFILLFVVPVSLAIWVMDVTSHLIGIVLTLLLKSFELVNIEMAVIDERLCLEILRSDFREIQRLQRRQIFLQRLHRSYVQVTQETIDCLSPQLILILLYNLSIIYTFSSGEWRRILQMGVIVNNLRSLLHTLDDLVAITKAPQNTSWMHLSQLLQFEKVLASQDGWNLRNSDVESRIPIVLVRTYGAVASNEVLWSSDWFLPTDDSCFASPLPSAPFCIFTTC